MNDRREFSPVESAGAVESVMPGIGELRGGAGGRGVVTDKKRSVLGERRVKRRVGRREVHALEKLQGLGGTGNAVHA